MHKAELPIRNQCHEDWDEMRGGPTLRHCARCDREVHDLSAMTRREAQVVIQRRAEGQRVCLRYTANEDGSIEFRREPLIPKELLLRGRRLAVAAGLSAVISNGCMPAGSAVGSAVAHQSADELAERGMCSVSLEPVLPVSLNLHANGCAPSSTENAQPVAPAAPVEAPLLPIEVPPSPPPPPPPSLAPAVEPAQKPRSTRAQKHSTKPKSPPRRTEILMGY